MSIPPRKNKPQEPDPPSRKPIDTSVDVDVDIVLRKAVCVLAREVDEIQARAELDLLSINEARLLNENIKILMAIKEEQGKNKGIKGLEGLTEAEISELALQAAKNLGIFPINKV